MGSNRERQTAEADSRRILLVEDNDTNRHMLEEYLRAICGYQVLSLAGGSNFFQTLADFQPNLILLNLKLPDIDCYTLLENIQHRLEWCHIPVIVICGLAFRADEQRVFSLGVRRYFIKPVNLTDLRQAIKEELRSLTA